MDHAAIVQPQRCVGGALLGVSHGGQAIERQPVIADRRALPALERDLALSGFRKLRTNSPPEARRQGSSGPMPIVTINARKIGPFTAPKNGGPTVIFSPRAASEMIGNTVPLNTANVTATSSQLLNRK